MLLSGAVSIIHKKSFSPFLRHAHIFTLSLFSLPSYSNVPLDVILTHNLPYLFVSLARLNQDHKEKVADELRAVYRGQDKLELLLAGMPADIYLAVVVNIHALEAEACSTKAVDGMP